MSDAKVGAALGLSATPERYGDEIGTKKYLIILKTL